MNMKRLIILTFTLSIFLSSFGALNKSVVNLITYDAEGKLLSNSPAVVCGATGEVVAAYSSMKFASSAEVIDCKGKSYKVTRILGASADYDLVRFAVEKGKKLETAEISVTRDSLCRVWNYSNDKKYEGVKTVITHREKYNDYEYFTLSLPNESKFFGCPVFDADGRVVALVQQNVTKNAATACAIDIKFAQDLKITSSSAMRDDLREILIPKALPENEEDAYSYLYLLSLSSNKQAFYDEAKLMEETYPENVEFLTLMAGYQARQKDYASSEDYFQKALKVGKSADQVHAAYSDVIYEQVLHGQSSYSDWTLEKALDEAEKAFSERPDTIYYLRQAHCLYGLKRYGEARDKYVLVARKTPVSSQEIWYYAARSAEMAGESPENVIVYLDSALTQFKKPYNQAAAPYLVARAQQYEKAGKARAAVLDYNDYERAMGPRNLTANFYYLREQQERKCRMFQQALDDMDTAMALAQEQEDKDLYLTEQAAIYLQVGSFDEAITRCEKVLKTSPDMDDAKKIIELARSHKEGGK